MTRRAELAGAFMLLTRLPVARFAADPPPLAACLWAYPVVGAVVGGIGAAAEWAATASHLSRPVAAILAVAAMALATGALHEDGLADTADGFGGGRNRERKLAIMRDSRIGSYGALALLFAAGLRVAAVAGSVRPELALLLAGVLGRGAMLLPLVLLAPARTDGLAASLARGTAVAGLAVTAAAGLLAPPALVAATAAALAMTQLMRRQVGGYTGDTLGATEQLAECTALMAL